MSIYDVFKSENNKSNTNQSFDKDAWAAEKQAQRKEAYELVDDTCSKIITGGDEFRKYLDVQGRFDRYSVTNAILVAAQMPEATLLKDNSKWRENHVYKDKDAQKVIILEPGKEYRRDDGSKAVSYNAKAVYDISQTTAKNKMENMEQKPINELVAALYEASPVPFQPVENLELPAFYDKGQECIFVRTNLTAEQLFISMAKETSAAIYDFKHNENRDASDFKSFCVAYMVSSKYGVDTKGFNFDRLPKEFEAMDAQALKNELGSMRDVLGEINTEMYKGLEKNKATKEKEPER